MEYRITLYQIVFFHIHIWQYIVIIVMYLCIVSI